MVQSNKSILRYLALFCVFALVMGPLPVQGLQAGSQHQGVGVGSRIERFLNSSQMASRHPILPSYDPAHPNSPNAGDFNIELLKHLTDDVSIAVTVSGNYAYVSDQIGSQLGLWILDISNPLAPVGVSFLDTGWSIQDIVVAGKYAYLTDYAYGLRIVDVSAPAHPVHVGSLSMPDVSEGVAYSNGYVYIADWQGGLRVVDDGLGLQHVGDTTG